MHPFLPAILLAGAVVVADPVIPPEPSRLSASELSRLGAPAPSRPAAPEPLRPAAPVPPQPVQRTAKERLSDKASDEQRVNDCKVPAGRRTRERSAACPWDVGS